MRLADLPQTGFSYVNIDSRAIIYPEHLSELPPGYITSYSSKIISRVHTCSFRILPGMLIVLNFLKKERDALIEQELESFKSTEPIHNESLQSDRKLYPNIENKERPANSITPWHQKVKDKVVLPFTLDMTVWRLSFSIDDEQGKPVIGFHCGHFHLAIDSAEEIYQAVSTYEVEHTDTKENVGIACYTLKRAAIFLVHEAEVISGMRKWILIKNTQMSPKVS
jgi:hypothetical protein